MSQLLNYKLEGTGQTLVLIHGLFGNLDNLGVLARDLSQDHQVLSIDLRNHGLSFHSNTHDYQSMAEDVIHLLHHLNLSNVTLIGHSMGGKVAMKAAETIQDDITKLIVLDMAPVEYKVHRHENVLNGLQAVIDAKPKSRRDALEALALHIEIDGVRQFLAKSLYRDEDIMNWRFNVDSLVENYWEILGWKTLEPVNTPTLFVKGAESDYLLAEHQSLIQQQFPNAKAHIIANTGHWLHAEKPKEVLRVMRNYL
ncbi:alpha/beta fold hydrolase [uncultured Vibrio sp.]|uniref:alpha/beta fold hydrolase n=1 Tax=uncultured Vibrio sp. TaxID=114054 RepID=UPI000912EA34|nr:alpha/beta fold hydrolase [uncultured Vibrio sp.]OIQ25933.1 MAG: histidine kinase [Vibrio sp. MedPE-SWchi]